MSDPRCGTHAGWSAHTAKKEKCCEACSIFRRDYMRERRRMRSNGRRFIFPIENVVGDFDAYGMGAAIARGLRESA
jgi:hypothetical protein